MSKLFVTVLLTVAFLSTTQQQYQRYAFPFSIPPVACPQYFQYIQSGSEIVGLLTIPFVASDMELFVHLSQRAPLQTNYFGKISLASDGITAANQVRNGGPISYRVEFPTNNEIPKLTKISVNGQDICIDSEYPRPSTRLYLNHKLRSDSQTLFHFRPQSNQLDNNFISLQGNSGNPVLSPSQFLPNNQPSHSTVNTQRIGESTQCGEDAGISAFIYGGDQIMRGQYPWLTAIYAKSAGLRFLCGGSLLSTRTVLSAAHCFKLGGLTANRLVVNVGRYNLEDYSEQDFQTREIQNLIIHPEYSTNVFPDADLAILHLRQPVQYTNYIRPICLWAETVDSRLIVGSQGVVAGWGGDETGRSFTPIPKKVEANIVSDSDCLRSSQAYSSLTSSRTLCAGNRDGSGPCMGDSGSGLMINRNGRWYLRGVVSAGQTKQQKCDLLQYVVFCDVAKHLSWVQSNTIA